MNPKKNIVWLNSQLPDLIRQGVLSEDTAEKLRSHYADELAAGSSRIVKIRMFIFLALSALLVSLGVALIIGHNWDHFSTQTRLVMGFLPFVPGAGLLIYGILRKKGAAWIEPGLIFHIVGIGTSIAVTCQIYNLGGNVTDFLQIWLLLLIPLYLVCWNSFILPVASGILFLFFCGSSCFGSPDAMNQLVCALFPLLPGSCMVYAIRKQPESRKSAWFRYLFVLFGIATLCAWNSGGSNFYAPLIFALWSLSGGCLAAWGLREKKRKDSPFLFAGFILFAVTSLILTAPESTFGTAFPAKPTILFWSLVCYALAGVDFLVRNILKRRIVLLILPILTPLVLFLPKDCRLTVSALLVLICVEEMIRLSARHKSLLLLDGGILFLCGLIGEWFFTRMFSILGRGIAFIVLGILFGVVNIVFLRKRKREGEGSTHEN